MNTTRILLNRIATSAPAAASRKRPAARLRLGRAVVAAGLATLALLLFAPRAHAQGTSTAGGLQINQGMTLPATCSPSSGDVAQKVFYLTSGSTGFYSCTATNTWTLAGGGIPGAPNGSVQFNNQGAFAGTPLLFASNFVGANPGLQVAGAIAACPVNGCHVIANFFGFGQGIYNKLVIPAGVWVHFMESRWECNTGNLPCIEVHQGGHIVGSGTHLTSAENGIGTDFNAHNMTARAVIQFCNSTNCAAAAYGTSVHWASGEQFEVHAYDTNTLTNGCIEVDNPGENFALKQVQMQNCNANAPASGSGLYVFGLMAGSAVFEGITSNGNQFAYNFDGVTSLTHAFRFKGDGNQTFLRVAPRTSGGGAIISIFGLTWEAPGTGPPILIDTSNSQAVLMLTDVAGDCGTGVNDFIQIKAPVSMSSHGFNIGANCVNEVNDTFLGRVIPVPVNAYLSTFWSYDYNGKSVDIAGSLGFTSEASAAVNGANQNFKLGQFSGGASDVRITGPTAAFSIGGLATVFAGTGPFDGRIAILNNTTSQAMTINNEDAGSTAANRITIPTGANVTLPPGISMATLKYHGATSRWLLLSTTPSPLSAQGFIDTTTLDLRDDFTGCTANSGNQVGSLGWVNRSVVAGATISCTSNNLPNPGLISLTTGAVQGQGGSISLDQNGSSPFGNLAATANWESVWIFRVNSCTTVRLRVGLGPAGNLGVVQPNNGMWLRFDTAAGFADANFTFETRSASVSTTSATVTACDTNFHKIRIRSAVAGTIRFSLDGGAETAISTNVPTANMTPMMMLVTDAAVAQTVDADLFAFKAFALGR